VLHGVIAECTDDLVGHAVARRAEVHDEQSAARAEYPVQYICSNAARRLCGGTWWMARLEITTSNDLSGCGSTSAPACSKRQLDGAARRAYAMTGGDGSMPTTLPSGLTARAARRVKVAGAAADVEDAVTRFGAAEGNQVIEDAAAEPAEPNRCECLVEAGLADVSAAAIGCPSARPTEECAVQVPPCSPFSRVRWPPSGSHRSCTEAQHQGGELQAVILLDPNEVGVWRAPTLAVGVLTAA
jgi:hypothetical protein